MNPLLPPYPSTAALRAVLGPQMPPALLRTLLGPLASVGSVKASPVMEAAMALSALRARVGVDAGLLEGRSASPPPPVRKMDLRRWTDAVLEAAEAMSGVVIDRTTCVERAQELFDLDDRK